MGIKEKPLHSVAALLRHLKKAMNYLRNEKLSEVGSINKLNINQFILRVKY